jgi:hypothetical protein
VHTINAIIIIIIAAAKSGVALPRGKPTTRPDPRAHLPPRRPPLPRAALCEPGPGLSACPTAACRRHRGPAPAPAGRPTRPGGRGRRGGAGAAWCRKQEGKRLVGLAGRAPTTACRSLQERQYMLHTLTLSTTHTWSRLSLRLWAGSVDTTSVVWPAVAQRTPSEAEQLVLPTPPLPPSMKYLRPEPGR